MQELEKFGELEKSSVSALVEEYKARLSQVIAFDNEIHRWSASYIEPVCSLMENRFYSNNGLHN